MKINRSHRPLAIACVVGLAACSSLLDVKNPNNVNQSDLSNPASAASQASGVLATVARAWGQILTPYSMATDELTWIGSRDAWQTLDQGTISEPTNEFVDAAFFYVGEARWWSDETIKRLSGFDAANTLPDRNDLAHVFVRGDHLYHDRELVRQLPDRLRSHHGSSTARRRENGFRVQGRDRVRDEWSRDRSGHRQ